MPSISSKTFTTKNGSTAKAVIFTGHYGSGKTNVAVNTALLLADEGLNTSLVDLDIVNPYFRSADNKDLLSEHGVRPILPTFANTNVDIPVLGAEIATVFETDGMHTVFDVGGDNGAVALGRYRAQFETLGYSMVYVANMYRPLTATAADAFADLREIEAYSGLFHTAIVNNSNLGSDTDYATITASKAYADELSALSGLPLVFTSATHGIGDANANIFHIENVTKQIF